MNTQIPIKAERSLGKTLLVHSIFYTIQGEGPFVGHPAVFVRLGGCNLQCPGCDTEYTVGAQTMAIDRIVEQIVHILDHQLDEHHRWHKPIVVISGGEPMRQTLGPFIWELIRNDFEVQIETNGTLFDPSIPYDLPALTIVCSPKAGKVNKELQPHIDALKYVISTREWSRSDGLPLKALDHTAVPHLARPWASFLGRVYLQPMDEQDPVQNAANQALAVAMCKLHGYTLCLQVHKIINVE